MKFLSKKSECLVYLPVASVITITHSKFVIKNVKKKSLIVRFDDRHNLSNGFYPSLVKIRVLPCY